MNLARWDPLDVQIGKENDEGDIKSESALNDEYSLQKIEERSKTLYETMFTNLYKSKNVKINKNDLSKQLLDFTAEFYKPLLNQINPYKLGEKGRKLEIGRQYATRILIQYGQCDDIKEIRKLVYFLVEECPDHGYVVDFNILSKFLKNVHKADFFGSAYSEIISEISNFMIENALKDDNDEINFIGFIEKEEPEKRTEVVQKMAQTKG